MSIEDVGFDRVLGPLLELVARGGGISRRDLLAQLEQVVETSVGVLGVDSAGLILLDDADQPRVVAATDPTAALLERAQADIGEGPGIDTLRTGRTTAVGDLLDADRYPRLRDRLGPEVRAVLSSPVRVGASLAGNFNAIASEPGEW